MIDFRRIERGNLSANGVVIQSEELWKKTGSPGEVSESPLTRFQPKPGRNHVTKFGNVSVCAAHYMTIDYMKIGVRGKSFSD